MSTNDLNHYQALLSRDARFDGRFFIGVVTTGIYCRPVCRVRAPKLENCRFFDSAASAEQQGFRPCLRCRPEQAPGYSLIDSGQTLINQATQLIDGGEYSRVSDLIARLGISDRHLRRLFQDHLGVTPGRYLRTRQLLNAKTLLMDTQIPIADVALTCGFGSSSQFYQQFKTQYGIPPGKMRRKNASTAAPMHFYLGYRPPYDWDALLGYFARRRIEGVESVVNGEYRRTVAIEDDDDQHRGWISVTHAADRNALRITIADSLAKVIPKVLARVSQMFDLATDPGQINDALGELAADDPGVRVPGAWDGFELATRAVLGQQVTVAAARTLAGRLAALAGQHIETPYAELTLAFPSSRQLRQISDDRLGEAGIIRARTASLRAIDDALANDELYLSPGVDVDQECARLLAVKGIGPWTTSYIAMRALRWPDAFPAADYGVKKALGVDNPKDTERLAEAWRPWRSYAVMHLWRSLS